MFLKKECFFVFTLTRGSVKFVHMAISSRVLMSGYRLRVKVASSSCNCCDVKWVLCRRCRFFRPSLSVSSAPEATACSLESATKCGCCCCCCCWWWCWCCKPAVPVLSTSVEKRTNNPSVTCGGSACQPTINSRNRFASLRSTQTERKGLCTGNRSQLVTHLYLDISPLLTSALIDQLVKHKRSHRSDNSIGNIVACIGK